MALTRAAPFKRAHILFLKAPVFSLVMLSHHLDPSCQGFYIYILTLKKNTYFLYCSWCLDMSSYKQGISNISFLHVTSMTTYNNAHVQNIYSINCESITTNMLLICFFLSVNPVNLHMLLIWRYLPIRLYW